MIPYIIKALLKQPSVYVNDLGTFSIQYQSAELKKDGIKPPKNIVVFDNTTDHDEIAFTNLVCQERQCMLTQGNEAICSWVESLKTALANNKSIGFEEFGTFSLQCNGTITFESDYIPALNTEFEGMGEVNFDVDINVDVVQEDVVVDNEVEQNDVAPEGVVEDTEVEQNDGDQEDVVEDTEVEQNDVAQEGVVEDPEVEQNDVAQEGVVEDPEVEQNDGDMDVSHNDEDDDEDDEDDEEDNDVKHKGRNLWWLYILIIIIAIGVLGLVFKDKLVPVYHQLKDKIINKTEQVDTARVENEIDAEIEATEPEDNESVPEETVPYEPETLKTTADGKYTYIKFESGHYYAIAGSLPNESDAERHIRQAGLDQYTPKLVLQDGVGNIRVCIGIFATEEEAETYAKSINPKYWVLK